MLNIITRCTRPQNLTTIKKSINTDCRWYIIFDTDCVPNIDTNLLSELSHDKTNFIFDKSSQNMYGYDMLNRLIDKIPEDDHIYILDDDTILHPDFKEIELDKDIIVFDQYVGGKDFSNLQVREAVPMNMQVKKVDIGQIIFTKKVFTPFAPSYFSDGYFIQHLFSTRRDQFFFINKVYSFYNHIEKPKLNGLPKVLLICAEDNMEIFSKKELEYESNKLNIKFIDNSEDINKHLSTFNPDSIITFGENFYKYPELSGVSVDFRRRWIHLKHKDHNTGAISYDSSMHYILNKQTEILVSFFTPIYNTGDIIQRTYEGVKNQTYQNWEWVIVNDSDDYKTYNIVKKLQEKDARIKIYDFKEKSGGFIGEVKYRAASLCNGKYIMELDHDDYLLPEATQYMLDAFKKYPDAKFVYSDCSEINNNHESSTYPDGFAFGYGSYHEEIWNDKVYKVCNSLNINPKTIRHIVGVPNHFRAWEKEFYHKIGGHNRRLSIADDYELIIRTFLNTRMVRIPKLLYLQFYHDSNTQNETRADIQRRVRSIGSFYNQQIKQRFEELGFVDWAYKQNPLNPLITESKFGVEENPVNYTYEII